MLHTSVIQIDEARLSPAFGVGVRLIFVDNNRAGRNNSATFDGLQRVAFPLFFDKIVFIPKERKSFAILTDTPFVTLRGCQVDFLSVIRIGSECSILAKNLIPNAC